MAALQYVNGLLMPGHRKSVEPMALRLGVDVQRLQQFLSDSPWDEASIWRGIRQQVVPLLGVPECWVVDETGWVKQGDRSVGVHHQYCGAVGKQANCQVCVQLVVSDGYTALPAGSRLYLPQAWCEDPGRRQLARVPESVCFQTKPQIALALVTQALEQGVPAAPVLGDAVYGDNAEFRAGLRALGLEYALHVGGRQGAWCVEPTSQRPAPQSLRQIAQDLPTAAWHPVQWRDTAGRLQHTRLAWRRVWLKSEAGDDVQGLAQWLIVDWPQGHDEPHHVLLAHLRRPPGKARALALSRSRWVIEQQFQRLKDELGLDHLEARSWRAFHHHLALAALAYSFVFTEHLHAKKNFSITIDLGEDASDDSHLADETTRLLSLLPA